MKIVIAIDSLKGSLTSMEAGQAIAEGIYRVQPKAEVFVRPLADGGEGTMDALISGMGGILQTVSVFDPLARPISAQYGILSASQTAIIEMSAAAGITLVCDTERNPENTTTYGVGQIIKDAIRKGCRNFIIGIGGSATNDGGIGMLQALGYEFLDAQGKPLAFGAKGLEHLHSIKCEKAMPELQECVFLIACDVTNPLCGSNGCSVVYGPQKGASPASIAQMDKWLSHYAALTKKVYPHADQSLPGCGAAGGMGFAFLSYLNGKLEKGVELILKETHLEEYIKDADLVITGEGRLDAQTVMGKAPIGVAALAKKYQKPVFAFAGSVSKNAVECNQHGIDAFFPILRSICSLEEAMNPQQAKENLSDTAEQVMRAWLCSRPIGLQASK